MNSDPDLEEDAMATFAAYKDEQVVHYSLNWQELNESTRETYRGRARSELAGAVAAADEDRTPTNNGVAEAGNPPKRDDVAAAPGNAIDALLGGAAPPGK